MMDPISTGVAKQVHQNLFEQAEQTLQKSNQQVSDFEKLREQLEQQDASQLQQMDQTNPLSKPPEIQHAGEVPGVDSPQSISEVQGVQIPEIKNMDELQGMVNHIRTGQTRLNQIISDATSGRTYSPQEMIAMQAEVGKITTELDLATKVVQHFVESVKTTLNMQL